MCNQDSFFFCRFIQVGPKPKAQILFKPFKYQKLQLLLLPTHTNNSKQRTVTAKELIKGELFHLLFPFTPSGGNLTPFIKFDWNSLSQESAPAAGEVTWYIQFLLLLSLAEIILLMAQRIGDKVYKTSRNLPLRLQLHYKITINTCHYSIS